MIKVGSDFSGVGAFNQALMRLGIEFIEVYACDIDKYARQTFIHNYGKPLYYPLDVYHRDIPKESIDIYMTSPPCQSFSMAGNRLGKDDNRGILFFNSLEFIEQNKPRYFIFENVKGLLSDNNGKTFSEWVNLLGGKSVNGNTILFPYEYSVPYHLYWNVLNSKDYGVPQNRERVFLVGIRDDADNSFRFPIEEHLNKTLKDVLEINVIEKYFLSDKMIKGFMHHNDNHNAKGTGFIFTPKSENDIANCIRANASICPTDNTLKISKTIYCKYGLDTCMNMNYDGMCDSCDDGDNYELNYEKEQKANKYKYQKEINESIKQDICTGLDASYYKGFGVRQGKCRQVVEDSYRIRRLTPRECFRLMDFPDSFNWICSDSQAYKQAGNSIVVNVLYKILKNLNLSKSTT